ncbi:hypothetical protein QBC36DRAFT_326791 [Triangularia setosa]|uniref:Protein kinase domain-containing protein n=1 Tax=Triangularia setosa TaxID=2587417 RepID=A0AAN6W964_9PEZI|nr:hypothetical protein QBC36DRAFT_326791 [Podospora setosa]
MAELVGLVLAIPPTIDLCLKYGRELKSLCAGLRQADAQVSERVIRLDNNWMRFTHQLDFLKRIQHLMEDDHREILGQTLRVLLSKLEVVTDILHRLVKHQPMCPIVSHSVEVNAHRVRYILKKQSLDKAIEELETWQRTADQSWFLLLRIADSQVDLALKMPTDFETIDNKTHASTATAIPSTVTIRASRLQDTSYSSVSPETKLTFDAAELSKMLIQPIPFSHISTAQRVFGNGQVGVYFLNQIRCEPVAKYQVIKKDARDLARKLQHNDPYTFGLLACKGVAVPLSSSTDGPNRQAAPPATLTMVFRKPAHTTGTANSLRYLLTHTVPPKSLSLRFDYAKQLARSVSYVHTFGFVHKNIRPESILAFTSTRSDLPPQSLFLVGFENFRREDGSTQRLGDNTLERNLYRHSSRQGASPNEDYVMQHDIYSLGVCLLEIGFWRSFIRYHPQTGRAIPTEILPVSPHADVKQVNHFLHTQSKDFLLHLARNELPQYMGTRYTEIAETCLTCLDPDNQDFGDEREFQDEDGIRVGVRYIEKVVLRLDQLCV